MNHIPSTAKLGYLYYRGFARCGTQLYAHDFSLSLGFLLCIEKNNKTRCYFGFIL